MVLEFKTYNMLKSLLNNIERSKFDEYDKFIDKLCSVLMLNFKLIYEDKKCLYKDETYRIDNVMEFIGSVILVLEPLKKGTVTLVGRASYKEVKILNEFET